MIVLKLVLLFLHKSRCCGFSLEAPCRGASNECPHVFLWRTEDNYPRIIKKYSSLTIALVVVKICTLSSNNIKFDCIF